MTVQEFLKKFGITIKNSHYFDEALTHNSYANEKHLKYTYQRLEFLGDAIIQMYVSNYLYKNYPKLSEGILTKYRSNIVREESFSMVAKEINLGQLIRLGQGELNSRGFEKPSILSDVFESFTAAIYLDQGEQIMLEWLKKTLFKEISKPGFMDKVKDYKSELQEYLQAENRRELKYLVAAEKNLKNDNKTEYTINVVLDGQKFGVGKGFSKQEAEQNAAKDCLSKLVINR
ncbi:ribonuclease III [Williamsoniiplasma somnilux]|uniref:Ribonuclease 3 n=1 Tax=Williamsoniiplasma somnilux TaxID=215578 RepID=A0A2K8NZG5_9MOLU|nr:ribonuclease III [Williamsoniiplasma somnilux]ATZ18608.1 ribonuclease III [Williamsoniiplasma somnilux]